MLDIEPRKIIVGVAPHQHCDAALEYAAVRARESGRGVHLVLVVHPVWGDVDPAVEVELLGDDLRRVDTTVLLQAERHLRLWSGQEVPISTEITHGTVGSALCRVAENSDRVVLQHHRMGRTFHLPSLSVSNAVASRAPVPVVAVPDGWHEAEVRHDVVVAAVKDAASSREVAAAAFEEAGRLGADVRLVRAWSWSDDEAEDEDPLIRVSSQGERTALLRERIGEEFADLIKSHPAVGCELVVVHGQAAYVLMDQSEKVRLLVMGRHEPAFRFGSHLGPVTRTMLAYSHCPVLVVDQAPAEER